MPSGLLEAFVVSFGVVFLAELGDKTQLMILAFATRYRWLPVGVGLIIGSAAVIGASVLVGATLGSLIPTEVLQLLGAAIFLVFAAWTLLGHEEDHGASEAELRERAGARSGLRAAAVVAGSFVVAEFGDKSMLAVIALSAQADPLGTWLGATMAEVAAGMLAIVVGRQIGTRLPRNLLRYLAAGAFALFGLLLLLEAVS